MSAVAPYPIEDVGDFDQGPNTAAPLNYASIFVLPDSSNIGNVSGLVSPLFPLELENIVFDKYPVETEFNELAQEWYRDTRMMSFIRQKAVHPAYQRIIGMGKNALPFIFRELEDRRGDWLWALQAITGENPASGITNFRQAVNAWLSWAKEHGYQ